MDKTFLGVGQLNWAYLSRPARNASVAAGITTRPNQLAIDEES
jgi:hypothetical protein